VTLVVSVAMDGEAAQHAVGIGGDRAIGGDRSALRSASTAVRGARKNTAAPAYERLEVCRRCGAGERRSGQQPGRPDPLRSGYGIVRTAISGAGQGVAASGAAVFSWLHTRGPNPEVKNGVITPC
jgi:hypothetical protein